MEEPGAMQLQELRAGSRLTTRDDADDDLDAEEDEQDEVQRQQRGQTSNGSLPGAGTDHNGEWPTESLCKSVHSQLTKESTLSTRPRRLQLPPLPRKTDFGEHYPDGGWGWVVCGAAFVVHFLCQGMLLACGTLYLQIRQTFETKESQTGKGWGQGIENRKGLGTRESKIGKGWGPGNRK